MMCHSARLLVSGLFLPAVLLAADVTGIWMGQLPGPNKETQDIAFKFEKDKQATTGVLYGDEFDLPLENVSISGDRVSFSVTVLSYYNNVKTRFVFNGVIKDKELELTRERLPDSIDTKAADKVDKVDKDKPEKKDVKQTFIVKRLG